MTTANVRPLVAGNWKMNGIKASRSEAMAVRDAIASSGCDVMIAPPATLISELAAACRGTRLAVGAQDCHAKASGAHTGDVSAEMVADAGATHVIVGHSERRADHGESDAIVRAKAEAVHRAGLTAIVCIGETEAERKAKRTLDVVRSQLAGSLPAAAARTIVAYEPVWAIGTGLTPTAADVAEVHALIRQELVAKYGKSGETMRILYGGSVKPANAKELMAVANVDGALVGGASLKAADFLGIISAYSAV
jgi:triosephosphate isomerase